MRKLWAGVIAHLCREFKLRPGHILLMLGLAFVEDCPCGQRDKHHADDKRHEDEDVVCPD